MIPSAVLLPFFLLSVFQQCRSAQYDPAAQQLLEFWNQNPVPKNYSTSSGAPVDDMLNSVTAGKNGPLLFENIHLFDDLQHFHRERIPERALHAKGAGAWGYFTVTSTAITKYTKALLFSEEGKSTPVFARFSTVSGESGSADTYREFRGFSVRHYTEEGNWDLVGFNFPIFFLRDPFLFPGFVHSQKKNPVTNLRDWSMFWDFFSLVPSCTLAVMMVHTSLGIPKTYRNMDGYGVNTFILENEHKDYVYAKFHYRTNQGLKSWSSEEATKLSGTQPDYYIHDLYNAIHDGHYPSWNMSFQVMTPEQAEKFPWDHLDVTKVWPEDMFPLIPIGTLTLYTNPKNYFAEVEEAAFDPKKFVPGIGHSNDRIMQGRMFSYADTQVHRVGVNSHLIPVNRPLGVKYTANRYRDGPARSGTNQGGSPNYYPNSFNGPVGNPRGHRVPQYACGNVTRHSNFYDDNYSQASMFWKTLSQKEKDNIVNNIVLTLKRAADFIQKRIVHNYWQVSEEFGRALQEALG